MVLFSPLTLRQVTLRNRIVVSPMCQYSSRDGLAGDWHLVHLGSRAVGGAGLIFTEAAAVEARGRISPADLGIWKDEQIAPLARITAFIKAQGGATGIQLAHAGRKASTAPPWEGGAVVGPEKGGWPTVAPSAIPFTPNDPLPRALKAEELPEVADAFQKAAARSLAAGMDVVEIHAAHGYLLHQFLSPVANQRTDRYGGPFENRIRLLLEVVAAVRKDWPERLPLVVRLSATDWLDSGGWDLDQTVELSKRLKSCGVDLIDCSSGGIAPSISIPAGPGYQVGFSERIRREAGIATAAVGFITNAAQAETILRTGQADLVLLAREFLRDPYWPLHAARPLRARLSGPVQYGRSDT